MEQPAQQMTDESKETPAADKSSALLRTPLIPELDFNKLKPEQESRSN